ncbi:MAG: winged helix DNA-binding protein [Anaerolineae bacterium]|nr:winged helix DNA-binding protein [Anaerolineae bacterium]MBT7073843.1 winged helix DNA-binding protein [Anaerolineae bacterium]MBT7782649.1 winged helix DNA-binding protein [Anaerolineae bacterium]
MPSTELNEIKANFIQGLSQISQFWGLPKSMGAIFAVLYLSPNALSLDEIVEETTFTKGAISTSVRTLARMGLVHRQTKLGDRKDYYFAEDDFYKVIRSILKGRENSEFSRAIDSVGATLENLQASPNQERGAEDWVFAENRVIEMKSFFDNLDNLVHVIAALETMNQNTVQKVIRLLKK